MCFLSNSAPPTLHPVLVPLFARYEVSHISGPILHMQVLSPHCTNPQHGRVPTSHEHCSSRAKSSGRKNPIVLMFARAFLLCF